ncbi:MBL fold metallo-hydrolase [Aeromonas jandaei]|uniref:ComEC/Rec2 family competence protein n=1 Tax=Aeromonas jandaei TaxID=650 RepID=UPI001F33213F|nr:hypothetical protein [Aeromonas jandaei]MCF7716474.1 MBL fold metallo-hydrolase [Aeromonas jandaei]
MGYEIDFLGVGEKSNSGDAIAVRFGNLSGSREEQTIVVIDAGYKSDDEKLIDHINTHYGTNSVDLVISTHPDQDHINGLHAVIEGMDVKRLWIHQPWADTYGLADLFEDGRVTDNSIGKRLRENLESAYSLVEIAIKKGIIVEQPFTGLMYKDVKVIGPTEDYYRSLIPEFDGMPDAKKSESTALNEIRAGFEHVFDEVKKIFQKITSIWGEDKIDDNDTTSAKNNSSVITQIIVDNKRLVFTGDAGITALTAAAEEINNCTSGATLAFIQVPHHGSKRNVGPTVLNKIIGEPIGQGEKRNITAMVSTAKEGEPKHPHKAVLNAFTHRGVEAVPTRGTTICHHFGGQVRSGWSSISPEPYHYEYDEEV